MVSFLVAALAISVANPTFDDIVQTKLKDLSLTASVVKAVPGELRVINRDFPQAYGFTSMEAKYKSPGKLRLEADYKNAHITYVIDGAEKWIRVPAVHQKYHFNLAKEPGKRQSMLDFGIVDRGVAEFIRGEFVRVDRSTGEWVFDLRYKSPEDTSRFRVWVSPKTKAISKREWYNQGGELRATFYYTKITDFNGVWIPLTAEVYNVKGKLGGITSNSAVRVNEGGIPDSLFTP